MVVTAKAQIINFPDANFKAKLLEANTTNQIASTDTPDINGNVTNYTKIDTNNDGEIQVSEAIAIKWLYFFNGVSTGNITNLSGIQSFTELQYLNCKLNTITNLNLSGMQNLKFLDCSSNQMTSINLTGLTNLQNFDCSINNFASLNLSGLTSLLSVNCSTNHPLTSLNLNGLTNLKSLLCDADSNLISINLSGFTSLIDFSCLSCLLSNIDLTGLVNLQNLALYNNALSSINLLDLTSLQKLDCRNNLLTALDLGGLANLQEIDCSGNQITSLNLIGLSNLQKLNCGNNQITSINVAGLSNLLELNCTQNLLPTLDVNGLTNLQKIYINLNNFTSVDFSSCLNLNYANCNSNPLLTRLNIKNGITTNTVFFDCPHIKYLCADDSEINTIQTRISQYGYTNCHVNTYCSFVPGGNYFTIQGNNKYDGDNDGCSATDINFPYLKIVIANGPNTETTIVNPSGTYFIPVPAGTQTITPIVENPNYFVVSPNVTTVTFPTNTSPFTQDFCITPNGIHQDLEVVLLPLNVPRPGFIANYKLIYKNKGNVPLDGFVKVDYGANPNVMVLSSAVPSVSSAIEPELQWDYTNLQPFETRIITFSMLLNSTTQSPPLNNGDDLGLAAVIYPIVDDEYYQDNHSQIKQKVVNAHDPNDKICNEGDIVGTDMIDNYVHYIIRFENTGTANAQNVVVKDIIDTTKFDINSLIPISGSHSFETKIKNTNKVEFIFENIDLPFDDANNDGYVAFKIKTKPTLVVGNTFSNSASIYFDYNFPIATNTFTTTIQALATQDFDFGNYFSVYPVPTEQELHIQTKENIDMKSIEIYNIVGQMVLAITNAESVSTIDVSNLKSGTYFIKVNTNKGTANSKFIKE